MLPRSSESTTHCGHKLGSLALPVIVARPAESLAGILAVIARSAIASLALVLPCGATAQRSEIGYRRNIYWYKFRDRTPRHKRGSRAAKGSAMIRTRHALTGADYEAEGPNSVRVVD